MSEQITDLVLEHVRLGSMERHIAGLHISDVSQNAEFDRLKNRLDRVERRLELSDS